MYLSKCNKSSCRIPLDIGLNKSEQILTNISITEGNISWLYIHTSKPPFSQLSYWAQKNIQQMKKGHIFSGEMLFHYLPPIRHYATISDQRTLYGYIAIVGVVIDISKTLLVIIAVMPELIYGSIMNQPLLRRGHAKLHIENRNVIFSKTSLITDIKGIFHKLILSTFNVGLSM